MQIDGHDVNRIPLQLLRSSIAMVSADSFLFSTTIEETSLPEAERDEVREAGQAAHVLEDIEDFPDDFETQASPSRGSVSASRCSGACTRASSDDPDPR